MTLGDKSDIWLALNIGDYLRDTMDFTTEEHGAYLLLIMAYHMNRGPLPDDDRRLQNIAKISRYKWSKIRQTLATKFRIENGMWHHKRCDAELRKAADYREKRRAQTEAARKAKAAKTNTVTETDTRSTTTTTTTDSSLRSESSPSLRSGESAPDMFGAETPPVDKPKPAKRGTRLCGDWKPPDKDWLLATQSLGQAEAQRQLETFRDYWVAQPGQRGVKLDWPATWRNWIRRASDFVRSNGARASPEANTTDAENRRRTVELMEKRRSKHGNQ